MTNTTVATVGDLIAALDRYDLTTPVRLATQPGYPLANTLARVTCTRTESPVVWLGAGEQIGYLPAFAADALGWS
ncbi:hypothetical protein [Amycolatopsis sp. NPDC059657]|uniref:hypothetical protein n=1 Tax=Amycolatopsis sp. NPDC059657 TaxID=3346899 RepID=UPI00366BEB35